MERGEFIFLLMFIFKIVDCERCVLIKILLYFKDILRYFCCFIYLYYWYISYINFLDLYLKKRLFLNFFLSIILKENLKEDIFL